MNTVLCAQVPIPNPAPSPWKNASGCLWRLCANRSRPNAVSLSLHLFRHHTDSSGFIIVNVEYPDIASHPVRNLHVAQQLPRHPQDLRLHLPSGESLTVVHLPLTYAPPGEEEITVKIDILIEEQPSSPTAVQDISFPTPKAPGPQLPPSSPLRHRQSLSRRRTQSRGSQIHSRSTKATSISWIDDGRCSSLMRRPSKNSFCSRNNIREMLDSRNVCEKEFQFRRKHEQKSLLCGRLLSAAKDNQALNNGSDVTLIVERDGRDNVEFYVHRCVLVTASPVFRAMFSCGMRENQTGRVELSHFDVSTVNLAVRHMYGENIEDCGEQNGFGIYRFGHQFDMPSLFQVAQDVILTKMCVSTCLDVLNFGVFFNDHRLEKGASIFILEHFSELASVKETLQKLYSLPPTSFLALLDSDMLVATELEVFLVSMKWLSHHEGSVSIKDILRRIRWSMMTQHMFWTAMNSPMLTRFPALRNFLKSSQSTISQHLNGIERGRRHVFGPPMVSVPVPALRHPPAALICFPEPHVSAHQKSGSQLNPRNTQELSSSSRTGNVFHYEDMTWVFRAELSKCKSFGCSHERLSASLWLEQNNEGSVSSTRQNTNESHLFPMKVKARCMVWNSMGGQFTHRVIDFTFQSSGWASGWCVEDVLGGHNQTNVFFEKLSSFQGVGPVLRVGIEILKCEKG